MFIFKRKPEPQPTPQQTAMGLFIQKLVFEGGEEIRYVSENKMDLDVTQVNWGIGLSEPNFEEGTRELAIIESYFDTITGEHVSTHVADVYFNQTDVHELFTAVADVLSKRKYGSYDPYLLNFLEVPLRFY